EYEYRSSVSRIEAMSAGQHAADIGLNLFVLHTLIVHPNAIQVSSIFQVSHGHEGDVNGAVDVIVVALLHFRRKHADHLKAHSVDTDMLAQGVFPGEKFRLGLRADHSDSGALDFIFRVIKAAFAELERANGLHV